MIYSNFSRLLVVAATMCIKPTVYAQEQATNSTDTNIKNGITNILKPISALGNLLNPIDMVTNGISGINEHLAVNYDVDIAQMVDNVKN